jgi:multiple sugar transport system permease protein/putative aldouronate transport system permease protein
MKKKRKMNLGQIVITIVMTVYAALCLLPMLLIVVVSFSSDESIKKNGFSFFPEEWSLKAWKFVLGYGKQLLVSYGVTIFITVVGTLLSVAVMSMFAYCLSRKSFELRKTLSVFMLITMLFSGGQLSSYLINTSVYGLKDTLAVLILPGIGAMNIIILRTYIQGNVHDSLIESAKLDGAGEFTIFTKIVLPIMKPAIASVSFMQAVTYWNDWNKAYLYIESANKTPLQLLLIRIEKNIQYILTEQNLLSAEEYASIIKDLPTDSGRMAILLTAIGPIMIAYPFFQKYFVKGLTVGSVKG